MRRTRFGTVVALGLVVAACSGSDGGDATAEADAATEPAGGSEPTAESDADAETDGDTDGDNDREAVATTEPVATTSTTTIPPIETTSLPGLIDTTDVEFPADPAVRTGVLDNGLTYYVRFNDQPGTRASLRLAVDAGSVDELGPESGVAHFAEHMLFNGTAAYPENQLIDVLRSFGADFGPDINAYTSFDETVYMLEVPSDDGSVGEAMNVLSEWLSNATIATDQVVAERGVVLDEWRIRTQTVDGRLFDIADDMYLAGTPYAGRSPIGGDADIESMSDETVREFYDAHYRPDNAAIVVVGDIDVDRIVARIEEKFSPLAGRGAAPVEQPDYLFEVDTEPDFALHADPDQATVDVEVTLPLPATGGTGTLAARAAIIDEVVFDALIRRLDRDVAAGVAPFDQIVSGSNSFVDELDAPALYAFTDVARVRDTVDALLLEYERAFRHGFSEAEIAGSVAAVRAEWDAYLERENEIQDAGYASLLVAHFLDDEPYPTVRDEYELIVAELDAITPAVAAERFNARWTNSAPHVIISAPESSADEMPDRAEILTAIAATRLADVEPREQPRDLPDELMQRPAAVAPTSSTPMTPYTWSQLDPVLYEFPNGVRVVLNPNTIAQGSVFFEGVSPGGSAAVADGDVIDALYAAPVVTGSGISEFNQAEFAEIVSTGTAEVDASIAPYDESMWGQSSTADAETMFQMIHLYMTEPRFDPIALNQVVQRERPVIVDPSVEPRTAGEDALMEARYGSEPRYAVLPTPEQFDTLDLDGVERVWRDRFGDASDWVFVFTGDLDRSTFEELAGAYLGTLPGERGIEQPASITPPVPDGITTVAVTAGTGDTAAVEMLFSTPIDRLDPSYDAIAAVATSVLDARLTRVVREEFGDSYSPFITTSLTTDPDPVVETYVRVTGAPGRIDVIAATVIEQIADIAGGGLTADEYATAYAPVEEDFAFVNNGEYLRELTREVLVPDYDFDSYVFEAETLDQVSQNDVVAFIRRQIPTDRFVQATTTPR